MTSSVPFQNYSLDYFVPQKPYPEIYILIKGAAKTTLQGIEF